jgi:hypothetical protein
VSENANPQKTSAAKMRTEGNASLTHAFTKANKLSDKVKEIKVKVPRYLPSRSQGVDKRIILK